MNYAALKQQGPLIIALLLVFGFISSNFHFSGKARDIERQYVSIGQEPAVFASDAYALASLNDLMTRVNSFLTDDARSVAYYVIYFFSIGLLWYLGKKVTGSSWGGIVLILFHVYSTFNYLNINQVLLSRDFAGQLLTGPFILLSLICFLEKRYYASPFFAAIGFYFQPAVCLWYLAAIFSYVPFAVVSEGASRAVMAKYFQKIFNFMCIFTVCVAPRLYQAAVVHGKPSLLDPQLRYDYLKLLWYSQTSLWMIMKYDPPIIWLSFLSNLVVMFLIVHFFWRVAKSEKVQIVLWMYIGSFLFLIFNEFLIHVVDFHFQITYGFSRTIGFNFLFMVILIAVMVVEIYKKKRFVEFGLWMCFMFNYAVLHYKNVSPVLQAVLLVSLVFIRFSPWTKAWDRSIGEMIAKDKKRTRKCFITILIVAAAVFIALTTFRTTRHIQKESSGVFEKDYVQAVQFVNEHNTTRGMVMFPFTKHDAFFYYTKNPGFFALYYMVLFIDVYNYDPDPQRRAYIKFKELEKEFDIDTMAILKKDIHGWSRPWVEAWEKKVNAEFIERWSKVTPIKFIIRENYLPDLPYPVVFQNGSYKVYER